MKIERITHDLLHFPLAKPVGGSGVSSVDVLVTEVELSTGISGLGFSYVLAGSGKVAAAAADLLSGHLEGSTLHHPAASWRALNNTFKRSGRGPNSIALAAIDVALWDAYAKAQGQALGVALGGAPRSMKVYGSGAYHAGQTKDEAAEVTQRHLDAGFRAVKPRVDGSAQAMAVLRSVRDSAPANIDLMCDANEKCSLSQAQRLLTTARDCGYLFVEEPLPAEQINGYRALGQAFPGLIATGEHLQGSDQCLPFIRESLCGTIQPDLAMIGGLTPSLEIARVAEVFGVDVSPHFLPGLFVHLAAACPNVAWLEDFPLIEPLFSGWPVLHAGRMDMLDTAGHGLSLANGARQEFSCLA